MIIRNKSKKLGPWGEMAKKDNEKFHLIPNIKPRSKITVDYLFNRIRGMSKTLPKDDSDIAWNLLNPDFSPPWDRERHDAAVENFRRAIESNDIAKALVIIWEISNGIQAFIGKRALSASNFVREFKVKDKAARSWDKISYDNRDNARWETSERLQNGEDFQLICEDLARRYNRGIKTVKSVWLEGMNPIKKPGPRPRRSN